MKQINCPLCKANVTAVRNLDQFGIVSGDVIMYHAPGPETGLTPVAHIGHPEECLGSGLTSQFAAWVAADLEAGIGLAAHP